MAQVERKKRNIWTTQRISSIIIICAAALGFIYSFEAGVSYFKTKQEHKELLQQKQELLAEYEMYQSLIGDHNSKIIIQENGYCYDTSSNAFYRCE